MSAITINFEDATLTSGTSQIIVSSGNFVLGTSEALSISGTIDFTTLYITSGAINFSVQSGDGFSASISVPVDAAGGTPAIEITHFAGSVTLMWPTQSGPEIASVVPNDPVVLNGFTS